MKTFPISNISGVLKGIGLDFDIFPLIILIALIITPVIIYSIFLLASIISLIFLKNEKQASTNTPSVSVVVAIRNGKKSITRLINRLLGQKYSGNVGEVTIQKLSLQIQSGVRWM